MSIRHGVYIQEEATAVQVPKTGNSSVQVVVGTAPVNMAENPSEAVNVPILANSGTEAMAALGYSVDFKNFTLCQTMFATSNLFQVSPVVYINVLDPAKHNKELAEAEYQVNQKQAVMRKKASSSKGSPSRIQPAIQSSRPVRITVLHLTAQLDSSQSQCSQAEKAQQQQPSR